MHSSRTDTKATAIHLTDSFGDGRTKGRVFNPNGNNGSQNKNDYPPMYTRPKTKAEMQLNQAETFAARSGGSGWQEDANCAVPRKHNYWFPLDVVGSDGTTHARRHAYRAAAKHLCETCPVITQCAKFAKAMKPTDGIWAGVEYNSNGPRKADQPEELF